MGSVITGFEPQAVFDYFEEISSIPRASGNERAISDYLIKFAEKNGLEYIRDDINNVIIKKPACNAGENVAPLILQGHTDMVCEKTSDSTHDFSKDPIKLIQNGEYLTADKTTLGADNGIAVAMVLAVLSDKNLTHPALECVFTSQEETGMFGAAALDTSVLKAKQMLNLDSEEEGTATVSCAGGMRLRLYKDVEWKKEDSEGIEIVIDSLTGGHSGCDIHLERANANKLAARMLYELMSEYHSMRISELEGGTKDNAIPRSCNIKVSFDKSELQKALKTANEIADEILTEIKASEPQAVITVKPIDCKKHMKKKTTHDIVKLMYLAPDGAISRNVNAGGFVVSSVNMGIVGMEEDRYCIKFSPRSSVESLQKQTRQKIQLLADTFGFEMKCDSSYPGWKYNENSHIRDVVSAAYRQMYGKEMKIEALHAGLECGLLSSKIKDLDAIAIGPNITRCHTPEECLDLRSVERTYKLITNILSELAK